MRHFDDLIAEAVTADVTGWRFDWLDGRATEERPPWGYSRLLAQRLRDVHSVLDLDTGGGEMLAEMPCLPARSAATEAWPPNLTRARAALEPRGVVVVDTGRDTVGRAGCRERLPFGDGAFELVTARHPVTINWQEIARVLLPGGHYFAQHVGPGSPRELIEYFDGPVPDFQDWRAPDLEANAARNAGLAVVDLRQARCRMEFHDIGAVVWVLRKCVWWVPDFTVTRFDARLRQLDRQLRAGEPFVAHSTRHLLDLEKPRPSGFEVATASSESPTSRTAP